MPDVLVTREQAEGKLPALCMCCGAPASVFVTRTLALKDPCATGRRFEYAEVALVTMMANLATTRWVRLRTAFCQEHRHYWNWRWVLLFGGLGVSLLLFIFCFALALMIKSRWGEAIAFLVPLAVGLV